MNTDTTDDFRRLLPMLCVVCAGAHVAFLLVFLTAGLIVMVAVNAVSIACYVLLLYMVRRGRTRPIIEFGILAGEILGHAAAATLFLGWNSGFHYYVLLMVPVTGVSTIRPRRLKAVAVITAGGGYIALSLWLQAATPSALMSTASLEWMYYFNVTCALLFLAGLADRYHRMIDQTQLALQAAATTDPLTGLRNRQAVSEFIQRQESRARRGHPLSFIMCDLDYFKQVNDRGGHAAGDAALQAVSACIAAGVRSTDVAGRWGGEEFLIVLPDAHTGEASNIAERLRTDIAALAIVIAGTPSRLTVTMGISTLGDYEVAAGALARADAALYAGKHQGRNRVVLAVEPHLHTT